MFVAAGAIIAFFGGILMEKMGVEKYILNYEAIKNAKTMSMENCRTKTSFIYSVENIETSYIVFFSAIITSTICLLDLS
jgi:hypothetical protein